ncbi:hypothetical protein EN935_02315 [Mesorhizobium sp. M7D.F.Ca.US.004.03.1.1]|uniref:hypothetical protein n=1 Tax=Mesorhizobium sp. M7D.F.Ca.US.004.03.1.1 TaxID=2496702 RepID=UPI000FCBF788|nr:hypothetical protein [Mesorhizobium sp. M7D.F.Ca.US.004.03.1.1]RVA36426.1 hypothetical protein EN935_02315 [Mesorhizobium sp. M7D.F.Ca.US.004.03.1.1]
MAFQLTLDFTVPSKNKKARREASGLLRFRAVGSSYQGTKDYNRWFAAFKAALKGPRPSKICFDAARASGFFTVR